MKRDLGEIAHGARRARSTARVRLPGVAWMRAVALVAALIVSAAVTASPAGSTTAHPRCHTRDLAGALQRGSPGAGQRYAVLVLRNRSRRTCFVFGYVGMLLVNRHGGPVPTRVIRDRARGRRVTLAPGARASSLLHWTVVPSSGEPASGPCEPTAYRLRVTPPDETTYLQLRWRLGPVCDRGRINVLRLRAGSRGF